jgi:hypothetical protein
MKETLSKPRTMKTVTCFLSLFVLGLLPALAEAPEMNEEMKAQMKAQFAAAIEELELTEEQLDPFKRIIEDNFQQRRAIMETYGMGPNGDGERPNMREMRKMRKEMQAVRKTTENELSTLLTPEQMELWKTMAEENREKMREQMKTAREAKQD